MSKAQGEKGLEIQKSSFGLQRTFSEVGVGVRVWSVDGDAELAARGIRGMLRMRN